MGAVTAAGPAAQKMKSPGVEGLRRQLLQFIQRSRASPQQPGQPGPQAFGGLLRALLQIKGIPIIFLIGQKDILKLAVHVIGKVMFLLIQGHILPVQLRLFGKLGKVLHCRAQMALFQPGKAQVLVKSSFHIHRSPFLLFAYINA